MTTILGKEVGPIGFGLMSLTNPAKNVSQAQGFAALKQALASGANFWDGGVHYGTPDANSLHLLHHYFTKYPDDADKVVLCIKGGMRPDRSPDGTAEGVRSSVDNCIEVLGGKKKLDLFECSRVDPNTPIETTVSTLAELINEGKIGGISLSEVKADTIRRAAKVHKISAVEVEVSLWEDHVLKDGIAEVCAEYDIPIIAYSPIGRGFLTGQLKSVQDIPEGDFRHLFPRFRPENFDKNFELVREVQRIADKKGITATQLAINWVRQLSHRRGSPVFIPIPGASIEGRVKENSQVVELNQEELTQIDKELESFEASGERYPEMYLSQLNG